MPPNSFRGMFTFCSNADDSTIRAWPTFHCLQHSLYIASGQTYILLGLNWSVRRHHSPLTPLTHFGSHLTHLVRSIKRIQLPLRSRAFESNEQGRNIDHDFDENLKDCKFIAIVFGFRDGMCDCNWHLDNDGDCVALAPTRNRTRDGDHNLLVSFRLGVKRPLFFSKNFANCLAT